MEALLYTRLNDENGKVQCNLCNHRCVIKEGRRGICCVRENRDGVLNSLVYGRLIASNVDPIEKKPIFHLLPGSLSYSIATVGCNFRCLFCQNADIAQMPCDHAGKIMGTATTPQAVVVAARESGCRSIAYTYTEPTVYFEFAFDTARLAHAQGLKNVFVTNGYMSQPTLEKIAPYLDGANVDLKSFSDTFYHQLCGAKLEPVKETLMRMKLLGILVEVTTLLIPGLNTDPDELRGLATFLSTFIGPDTPWHISRYHPTYKLTDRPTTPVRNLLEARQIGLDAGLKYVYTGNVRGQPGESTYCSGCEALLIDRQGFTVNRNRLKKNRCPDCNTPVAGIF
jgi:pyruvate formate lyase activating enzyme